MGLTNGGFMGHVNGAVPLTAPNFSLKKSNEMKNKQNEITDVTNNDLR